MACYYGVDRTLVHRRRLKSIAIAGVCLTDCSVCMCVYKCVNLQHVLGSSQQSQLGTLVVLILHGRPQRMHQTWNNVVGDHFTLSHQLLLRRLVTIGPTCAAGSVNQLCGC